jgi:acetylornithine deacetylase/succinyl-diaminopimelate desuccinylase-like protein
MQLKVVTASFLGLWAFAGFAQQQVGDLAPNPTLDGYLAAIESDTRVQQVLQDYHDEADNRFKEHMEVVRIASPSRQEYYRAKELYDRLIAFGFADSDLVFTGKNNSGIMPGSAVQQVDGLKVYQTCAVIPGTWTGATDGANGIYARPKVVIEGHIDTVNPSEIPGFDPDAKPLPWYYEPVKMQPAGDPLASTAAELAAIPKELNFDANGKVVEDANWTAAKTRFTNLNDAAQNGGHRIYVPGYSDAINNTIGVYHLAKLFKTHDIKPVHDIWFCFTAGEEGRGNLAGMKQLYGYNQDNAAAIPADNGRNKLNIVANLSIDGGNMTMQFLGSYRYEVNYKGINGAREASRRIGRIAEVYSPSDDGTSTQKTTYTVGIAYKKDDGSTSFEIDMRAPQVPALNEMKSRLYPKFGVGTTTEDGVEIAQLWYGDRPAHIVDEAYVRSDPLIYAAWKTRCNVFGACSRLPTTENDASSVNDNIPAAINIPTLNLNLGVTAAGGGGHAFNEWGVRGSQATEDNNVKRVLYTLLAVSGLASTSGAEIVPAAYPPKAPGHTNEVWDSETIWQK